MTADLTLDSIDRLRQQLVPRLRRTPTSPVDALSELTGAAVWAKFELWQKTGSFKARGALANCLDIDASRHEAGVTAVSAGNHAIATAWAAQALGLDARVVMTRSASPIRIARARAYGADVVLADDVHDAFREVERIVADEGRTFVHPFEGLTTAMATAGVGRELVDEAGTLDAVIVPVGGGGLAAGVATAVKLAAPGCAVFGVEPEGADSMSRSFEAGEPVTLDRVDTIADSLGAPMAMPVSFDLCRAHVDEIVRVDDAALVSAMLALHDRLSLVVEPACAAALAALCGPLQERLRGCRVGLVLCGSNIDVARWTELTAP